MAKSLDALSGYHDEISWPKVLCTQCLEGSLAIHETKQYPDATSRARIALVRRGLEGPEELTGTFTGTLRCDNASCAEEYVIAGDWVYTWEFDEVRQRDRLEDRFALRYVNPTLPLLMVPARTPVSVATAIATASAVLWVSPDLAATQLRLAVEELLTSRKVRRTEKTAKNKRRRLSTQERLRLFAATHIDVVHALEAVKWIGNAGTHESGLTVADVAKGAKLLELALRRLYDTTEDRLLSEAREINRRRGLPRTR